MQSRNIGRGSTTGIGAASMVTTGRRPPLTRTRGGNRRRRALMLIAFSVQGHFRFCRIWPAVRPLAQSSLSSLSRSSVPDMKCHLSSEVLRLGKECVSSFRSFLSPFSSFYIFLFFSFFFFFFFFF